MKGISFTVKEKQDLCDIIPRWKKRILDPKDRKDLIKTVNHRKLNISSPACCIVGEAYGFHGAYIPEDGGGIECDTCSRYSLLLAFMDANDFYASKYRQRLDIRKNKTFKQDLLSFIEHFKKEHRK